jgi:hypothetical protein
VRSISRNALSSIFRNILKSGLAATKVQYDATPLFAYQFRDTPVLKTAVREVSSNDKWDLLLRELLDGDLQGICLSIGWYEYRGVHADGSLSCVIGCHEERWNTASVS